MSVSPKYKDVLVRELFVTDATKPNRATPMAKNPKGKKFVENRDAAIDLARSVADVAERKSKTRIMLHHAKASVRANPEQHARTSSTKEGRLERAKALVAAQTARVKREKAKLRKKVRQSASQKDRKSSAESGDKPTDNGSGKVKKRVTFS